LKEYQQWVIIIKQISDHMALIHAMHMIIVITLDHMELNNAMHTKAMMMTMMYAADGRLQKSITPHEFNEVL